MEAIYICNPGEVVVYLNPERVDGKDGTIATVKGIKNGKVELHAMSSFISNKNKSMLVKPNLLIDSQEADDESDDDLSAEDQQGDCDSDEGIDDSFSDVDDFGNDDGMEGGVEDDEEEEHVIGVASHDEFDDMLKADSAGEMLWHDRIALGKSQLLTGQRNEAYASFMSAIASAVTNKQKARSILYAADSARVSDQTASVVSLYQDYLQLYPTDVNVKARLAEAYIFTNQLEEAAAYLEALTRQHARSVYVWQQVVTLEQRRQHEAGVLDALQKSCFTCALPSSMEGVQSYLLIGHTAIQFISTDPWLSIRIFIRALNSIKALGHSITTPPHSSSSSSSSSRVTFSEEQSLLSTHNIIAETWYLLGKAFQQLDIHFKKTQRDSSCLPSALVAFQFANQFEPTNTFYIKAIKDLEKKLQSSK